MGWTHRRSKTNLKQSLQGRLKPAGPGRCLQVHFRGPKFHCSAASQRIQHCQAPRTRHAIKLPMGWTHDHSEVHLGQALIGRKRPPGPGRSLQVHFRGPKVQLSPESHQNQHSQSSCTRQKIKPPMGWTQLHSKTNLEQSLSGCQQPAGTRWTLQAHLSSQRSNSQQRANKTSTLSPPAPGKRSNRQ